MYKMCFFLLILIFNLGLLVASTPSNLTMRKIDQLKELETKIKHEYDFSKIFNKKKLHYKKIIRVIDCNLSVRIYAKNSSIIREMIDLRTSRPYKRPFWKKQKGYGIIFGPGIALSGGEEANLYYQSKTKRRHYYNLLKRITDICRRYDIKKYYQNKIEDNKKTLNMVGGIPEDTDENAGKVYTEEFENKSAILNGQRSFYERYKRTSMARRSIYFQALTFRADSTGIEMGKLLMKKRAEGLDVKILVDGRFINDNTQPPSVNQNTLKLYNNLMASGIRVLGYSCNNKTMLNEFIGTEELAYINHRSHQKIWVVDGDKPHLNSSVGIVGGINFSYEYFNILAEGIKSWPDWDVALKGDVVKDIRNAFLRNFKMMSYRNKTHIYDHACFNPYDPIKEKNKYIKFKNKKTKPLYADRTPNSDHILKNLNHIIEGDFNDGYKINRPRYHKVDGVRFMNARPDEEEFYIYDAYLSLVNNAKKEILICNYYFIGIPEFKEALINAAKRGVKIRILTNGTVTIDLKYIAEIGRSTFWDIVKPNFGTKNQIKFYEFVGRKKGDTKRTKGMIHSKYMIVDNEVILIGSFNIGNRSYLFNRESAAIVESSKLSKELKKGFLSELKYSKEVKVRDMKYYKNPRGGRSINSKWKAIKYKNKIWWLKKIVEPFV